MSRPRDEFGPIGTRVEHGGLHAVCGLIAGRLTQFADALHVSASEVLGMLRELGVRPFTHVRHPSEPDSSCLSLYVEDFARLRAAIALDMDTA